ncbi:ribonuclease Z [Alicyclobacillus ferrooxydans]|uniref:Ribonuclease Z n=1 Tax=Alicyclobacillus ferrooxydans TaxID=471514 RepID=A0A0P9CUG0_9BACL|nr:ribonuclease Z [Alicyclobacillus ferrooxydans]KPV43324.1 ribonuclease Z [Alicyclobacillus ferrooxydans]
MELHFLGTGAGLPSKIRNVTSLVLDLLPERGTYWMFDCGEGTQHQVLHSRVKLSKLDKMFVTHLHGDHIFGIPGVLSSRSFHGGTQALTIYGPPGVKDYVMASLNLSQTHLTYPIEIQEISEAGGVIFQDDEVTVSAQWLLHGIPSLGYRIVEADRPGEFYPQKAMELGLPPGPLYAALQAGQTVESATGRQITPEDVLGPPRPGRTVTILGDTRPCDAIFDLARDADVLVHEATFSSAQSTLAHAYHHSTTVEAAKAAKRSNVGQLILTHVSARYRPEDVDGLTAEAMQIFPDVHVASDFLTVPIKPKA